MKASILFDIKKPSDILYEYNDYEKKVGLFLS